MESSFSLKIRARRRALGLTQADLAERVGISTSYFNLIERGKRTIGGALLLRIARALDLDPATLDDASERRLAAELTDVAGDPLLADLDLGGDRGPDPLASAVAALVGRHPGWARALARLHRECRDRGEVIAALSDRLGQDPFLSDIVHRMLTTIAGIRSTAEILASVEDITPDQSRRFHTTLAAESASLSDVAQALADFFDQAEAPKRAVTPGEEVDDFILVNDTHFPTLETEAERFADALRAARRGGPRRSADQAALVLDGDLITFLDRSGGLPDRTRAEPVPGLPEDALSDGIVRALEDGAPAPSRRFALARLATARALIEPIEALVAASPTLGTATARRRARGVLAAYAASALLFPYDTFRDDAERLRYDIGLMRRRYRASFEQICQRTVSLRRPGAEGVPFAMLRADPAGTLSKRFPLPNLAMPRHGSACSLWAIYGAFQTPGSVVRQLAETPSGDRFLFVARTVAKGADSFGAPARLLSVAIACDARHAHRLVYADGLDLSTRARADAVGVSCRVCPRKGCRHRAADSIVPT
ncbi:helix-turn-helix domain-containing protein [Roseospira visakhapatnamensis]|uniref:HTH cro/C1-type domain-containing protein n=1 Tax=Roseospira visakhapatnamensis TaxID=390880 RepID=A0A7W6R9V5_9PROT|nr:XRE family transcriptional regulator [Roseospira visakhapatnamensis]MBB4264465.1 hypothetical protein [Roseospira visakhapatnamensis]